MDTLREVDAVAHVRFASVYRDFREAKDFETILGSLSSLAIAAADAPDEAGPAEAKRR